MLNIRVYFFVKQKNSNLENCITKASITEFDLDTNLDLETFFKTLDSLRDKTAPGDDCINNKLLNNFPKNIHHEPTIFSYYFSHR